MESQQKSSLAKLILILCIIFSAGKVLGVAGYLAKNKSVKVAQPQVSLTSMPTPTAVSTSDNIAGWQNYRNEEYGFKLKYPEKFYVKENYFSAYNYNKLNSIITLSSSDKFAKEEFAFLLSIENLDSFNKKMAENADNETVQFTANNLGLELLKKSLNTEIIGTFAGDPPWGYYFVYIKIPNGQNKGLLLTARIHQADDPVYGGGKSDFSLFRKILSTFKFIE